MIQCFRGAEDELSMRKYLQEGDLISAEVQNIYHDGSLSLHTRSLKYGKLGQGCLLKVGDPALYRDHLQFGPKRLIAKFLLRKQEISKYRT